MFSIVIPAHNAEATIERCLNSVAGQTWRDYEVVVVDDGSTDATAARVAQFGGGVRLIRQEQRGAPFARNVGLLASVGTYVLFLDSDDEVGAGWLASIAGEVDRVPSPLAVTCGVLLIQRTRGQRQETRAMLPRRMGPAFSDWRALFLPGAYAIQRRVLLEIGGFAEGCPYGEHWELALRLATWADGAREATVVPVDRLLVTRHHDRTPARVAEYDVARRRGAEYQLMHHADRLARDPRLAADFHAVAGVASVRLGQRRDAFRHFRRAARLRPSPKQFGRLAALLVPRFVNRRWRRVAPGDQRAWLR